MLTFYCVLVGDKYSPAYAYRLEAMLQKHVHRFDYDLTFITDQDLPALQTIEALDGFPGWWQKLTVFQPGFARDRAILLDIDIAIIDELDSTIEKYWDHDFAAPKDWSPAQEGSIAAAYVQFAPWNSDARQIFTRFTPDVMKRLHGDQNWMTEVLNGRWTEIPEPFAMSYKRHCLTNPDGHKPPEGTKIVCFHGKPDPHEVSDAWVRATW